MTTSQTPYERRRQFYIVDADWVPPLVSAPPIAPSSTPLPTPRPPPPPRLMPRYRGRRYPEAAPMPVKVRIGYVSSVEAALLDQYDLGWTPRGLAWRNRNGILEIIDARAMAGMLARTVLFVDATGTPIRRPHRTINVLLNPRLSGIPKFSDRRAR